MGYHTEGDFDRLMLVPLAVGIILTLFFGWDTVTHIWRYHEIPWLSAKLTGVGFLILCFGWCLVVKVKPENIDRW